MANVEDVLSGPVPGQSLTQDPEMRSPWEMPTKYNSVNSAMDHLMKTVTSEAFIRNLATVLEDDKRTYIDELAAGMLDEGFINGLWTVDVMMQLAEPLVILLVWAAAQMGEVVSFSSDTGYEDRTGYEDLFSMLMEDTGEEAPEGAEQAPADMAAMQEQQPQEPQAMPQSPLAPPSNTPSSPLAPQGGM